MFPRANGKSELVECICVDCGNPFWTPREYTTRERGRKVRCDVCQEEYTYEHRKQVRQENYIPVPSEERRTFDRPGRYIIIEDKIPYQRRVWSNKMHYASDEWRPRMGKSELFEAKKNDWFVPGTIIKDSETGKIEEIQ